jgi:phospholipase C
MKHARPYKNNYGMLSCLVASLTITLFLVGCGANFTGSTAAPTVGITAQPASITAGSSSTLNVTATNATEVTVTGTDGSSYSFGPAGGTQEVSPASTTSYTAVAAGIGGKTSASMALTVTASPAPIVSMTASPASVTAGTQSTLTVTATNATQVVITGTDGTSYTLAATGGTQTVSPAATTTYTVTATGAGGTASATTTVTVTSVSNPAATVSITASPASMSAGASSTLTVVAANATQVVVKGSDGSSYTLQPTGGTQVVTPTATTRYTATATGSGGNATATAVVTVTSASNPAATVSISASPASVSAGASSTLTVVAANATQVVVKGSDGSSYPLQPSGGTQVVTPAATTIYTATATGTGGNASDTATVTVLSGPAATVTITANSTTITAGSSSTLTVIASNATQVTITGSDGSTYALQPSGGTQAVTPSATTTYTAAASGTGGNASAAATVTVIAANSLQSIQHVVFMLQENHTFDNYFGMLNPYRQTMNMNVGDDGNTYNVDGIDDKLTTSNVDDQGTSYSLFKLTSTCVDDESSDWLASYGDVNTYDFLAQRPILMDGFVHNAEGYAASCSAAGAGGSCSGTFTDTTGERSMGYYDQEFLNYYYYMASEFALSDRWFSPVASKSIDNRIATFTGGTTQGLVHDPGGDDKLPQLEIPNIFEELDQANVSWKIYYTVTQGFCLEEDDCTGSANAEYPATDFSNLTYSLQYLYENPTGAACTAPTQPSSVVGDSSNSFCIDPNHIVPLSTYFSDLTGGTLPSFAFIEAGYGNNDEHPGSGQSILEGQAQVANVVNSFMASSEWNDSVFFLSYDEGGGPYDHVPPVPGHSNDYTDASLGTIPDIAQISVNPDTYNPCLPPDGTATLHCDLLSTDPGANSGDAPAVDGFAAQLGFRLPNMIVSPFTRKHYVSHTPMDHTAVIEFVENRFINSSTHLTSRDAAQPNLLEFFDFTNIPWATPPTPPAPVTAESLGYNPCTPGSLTSSLRRR